MKKRQKIINLFLFLPIIFVSSCSDKTNYEIESNYIYAKYVDLASFEEEDLVNKDKALEVISSFTYNTSSINRYEKTISECDLLNSDMNIETSYIIGYDDSSKPYHEVKNNGETIVKQYFKDNKYYEDNGSSIKEINESDIDVLGYFNIDLLPYSYEEYGNKVVRTLYNLEYYVDDNYIGIYGNVLTLSTIYIYEHSYTLDGFLLSYSFINKTIDDNGSLISSSKNSIAFKYNDDVKISI